MAGSGGMCGMPRKSNFKHACSPLAASLTCLSTNQSDKQYMAQRPEEALHSLLLTGQYLPGAQPGSSLPTPCLSQGHQRVAVEYWA